MNTLPKCFPGDTIISHVVDRELFVPQGPIGKFYINGFVFLFFFKLCNSSSSKREMFPGTYARKEDFPPSRMLPDELLRVVLFGGD